MIKAKYVNLLPSALRVRRVLVGCLWNIAAPACITMLAVAADYLYARQSLGRVERDYEKCMASVSPIREAVRRNVQTRRRLEDLEAEWRIMSHYATDRRLFQALALIGDCVQRCGGDCRLQRIGITSTTAVSAEKKTSDKKGDATPQSVSLSISIQGVVGEQRLIGEYIELLRESEVFEAVDLKSSSRQSSGEPNACVFVLECRRTELL